MSSIPQVPTDVKPPDDYIFGDPPREYLAEESDDHDNECSYDGCHEPVCLYRLCFDHLGEEEMTLWDAQQAERETCLVGVGR